MTKRYSVIFTVNKEITCILENLSEVQAYDEGVPYEAFVKWEGSRWHVTRRPNALLKIHTLEHADEVCIAYQHPPVTDGIDTEAIYVQRTT